MVKKLRGIAIYLPQFHPIPENDSWWGKGFTEWTNVTKARPLFDGHYQPHLPADLGFYDLRLPEARQAQADLARQFGIHGFCYYHYWFNGRRLLERPFQEVFESGKPDFPFMLCWANESWSRTWDGREKEIIMRQQYSAEDDLKHIRSLIPYFKDPRYIKIDGKPVFSIYRSSDMPNIKDTIRVWRKEAERQGLELYLCRFEGFDRGSTLLMDGFDAAVAFEPIGSSGQYLQDKNMQLNNNLVHRVANKSRRILDRVIKLSKPNKGQIRYEIDYAAFVNWMAKQPWPDYKRFPCVTPMWDNSARRKTGSLIMRNANPQDYSRWLEFVAAEFLPPSAEENLIFINAWNEWAEGNHLEPCQKWGLSYLQSTKDILDKYK